MTHLPETYFGMTLQWSARFAVEIDDHAVRVTRQIHPYLQLDLCHLFVDLLLRRYLEVTCGL